MPFLARRRRQAAQLLRSHPAPGADFGRVGRDLAIIGLRCKGLQPVWPVPQDDQRAEAVEGKSELFAHLADRALLRRLARLEPSARQRPQPLGWRPVALDEEQVVAPHDGDAGSEERGGHGPPIIADSGAGT